VELDYFRPSIAFLEFLKMTENDKTLEAFEWYSNVIKFLELAKETEEGKRDPDVLELLREFQQRRRKGLLDELERRTNLVKNRVVKISERYKELVETAIDDILDWVNNNRETAEVEDIIAMAYKVADIGDIAYQHQERC